MTPSAIGQTKGTKMSMKHLPHHKELCAKPESLHQNRGHWKLKACHQGNPQGSVAGPSLWNITISGLIETLFKVPNLEIVTYADDILLIIHGPSHEAVITSVEEFLNTIEEWCSKHKLELSKDKTAIMPTFVRKRDLQQPSRSKHTWYKGGHRNEIPRSDAGLQDRLVSPHTF